MLSQQDKDIELFSQNYPAFVVACKPLLEKVVNRFAFGGSFSLDEREDIQQEITEHLLKKEESLQSQYQGKAQLKTFITQIARNKCIEIIRAKNVRKTEDGQQIVSTGLPAIDPTATNANPLLEVALKRECKRLHIYLEMFGQQKPKVRMSLKAFAHLELTVVEIKAFCPKAKEENYETLLLLLSDKSRTKILDKDIFAALTTVINSCESKQRKADAIRIWLLGIADELARSLNKSGETSYDRETIRLLFERCLKN